MFAPLGGDLNSGYSRAAKTASRSTSTHADGFWTLARLPSGTTLRHERAQHRIHSGLVTRPLFLEPLQDVGVDPQRDRLLGDGLDYRRRLLEPGG